MIFRGSFCFFERQLTDVMALARAAEDE